MNRFEFTLNYGNIMFTSQTLVGLQKEDAINILKKLNAKYRIVKEDNQTYIVTQDYVTSRYNLTIMEGKVTNVTMG